MKGTLFVLLNVVFLLLLFTCLARSCRAGRNFGSKTYHMLLLLLLKADMAFAHMVEDLHLVIEQIFQGYHYSAAKSQQVRIKEQRLLDYRQQCRPDFEGYRKREKYNRKILQ